MSHPPSVSHREALIRELREDPELAAGYLQTVLEDYGDEPRTVLVALRQVAEAQGMQQVADLAGIKRESLYRSLSSRGNPTLKTLQAVLGAVGLRLSVEKKATGTQEP